MLLVLGLLASVTLVLLFFIRRRPAAGEPPVVKYGLPVVGPLVAFSTCPRPFLHELQQKYGQAFTVDLLFDKFTYVLGCEGNKLFFEATDEVLDFNSAVAVVAENVLGRDSYLQDLAWSKKASGYIIKGFMKYERLNLYTPIIEDEIRKHVDSWCASGEPQDLFRSVSRLINHINIRCVMGDDAYAYADEISAIYYELEDNAVNTLSILLPRLPTQTQRSCNKSRRRLLSIISDVINNRSEETRSDYIGMCWEAEKDNHPVSSFTLHALAIMFAAHTNTTASTSWTLAMFSDHKNVLEKARAEQARLLKEHRKNNDSNDTKEVLDINHMDYLDACMKEAIRKHSMLMLVRRAMRDVSFTTGDGRTYVIPRGRTVMCSPFLTHSDPEVYPDPEKFDPERFMDPERRTELAMNRNFIHFGFGRHKCLGERFANLVIKSILSYLLRNCEIELVGKVHPPGYRKQAGTPNPEHPITIKFSYMNKQ